MFCCNSCCRPSCNLCPNRYNQPCRTIINNVCPSNLLAAQFDANVTAPVVSGSTIPLTNTIFNNANGYIVNNAGLITLTGPGLYYVSYSVVANNTTTNSSSATVGLAVNGVVQPSLSAQTEVGASETETLNNSTLVSVANGTTASVNLLITSDETLNLLPNVVVLKLS